MPASPAIQTQQLGITRSCNCNCGVRRESLADDLADSRNHLLNGIIVLPELRAGIVRLSVQAICFDEIPLRIVSGECRVFHRQNIPGPGRAMLPIFRNHLVMGIDRKISCDAKIKFIVLDPMCGIETMYKVKDLPLV